MATMNTFFVLILFCFLNVLFLSSTQVQAQNCTTHTFSDGKRFAACINLPVLDSSLHWNYHPSTHTVDIAFKHTGDSENKWIAWAINPTSTHMIGSQALVALRRITDRSLLTYTSPVTSYHTLLQQGNLSFNVQDLSGEYKKDEIVIFATLTLPGNSTIVNHLWQVGPVLANNVPGRHAMGPANMQSSGTVDFISGKVETSTGLDSKGKLKIVHGALNGLSWGLLMPIGVLIARYLKIFPAADPAWFYIHMSCQGSASVIGLGGLIIGFWLGSQSQGVRYTSHQAIGIALAVLCALQIFIAVFFRPHKDSKKRIYFNVFHRLAGYATVILGVTNCFLGLNILSSKKMLIVYAAIIGSLVFIAFLLEIIKCFINNSNKSNKITNPVDSI